MQKILVATPVKGGLSTEYALAMISLMIWKQTNYSFQLAMTKGTSVAMARCELAKLALDGNFDKMVFLDKDLGPRESNKMLSMFARLISHDVDIVGCPYVGHNINSKFHGATDSTHIRPDGLQEMEQIPIGFSCTKVSALRTIMKAHPHLEYVMKQTDDAVPSPKMFEFFPNGIVGPTTGQGKIARLRAIVGKSPTVASIELMEQIAAIVYDDNYSRNYMMGEDYFFCMLARTAGLKLYIDNQMVMPHLSEVRLPATNRELLDELLKEWRMAEGVSPETVAEFTTKLRAYFPPDIP